MPDAMNSYGFYIVFAPFVLIAIYMLISGGGAK
jgi:hypothetical protein